VCRRGQREEDRLADPSVGKEHHQPVDTQPQTTHGRAAEFQGLEEVLVKLHRLRVTRGSSEGLLGKHFALDDWVDELGEASTALHPANDEVPGLNHARIVAVRTGQRLGDSRVITDEGGVDKARLDEFTEKLHNDLAGLPRLVDLNLVLSGDGLQLLQRGVKGDFTP